MSSWVRRSLTSAVLAFPVTLWVSDNLFSFVRVRGTSMEPTLSDGDIVLVRKSDVVLFSNFFGGIFLWDQGWDNKNKEDDDSSGTSSSSNNNHNNNMNSRAQEETARARIRRMEQYQHQYEPEPFFLTKPPMVLGGQIIVFCSPDKAFPPEYNIKRVIGVGGQVIRPRTRQRHSNVELVPSFSLWVEGDNAANSNDSDSSYGPISKKLLVGHATRVVWPPSRWRTIGRSSNSNSKNNNNSDKPLPWEGRAWWP